MIGPFEEKSSDKEIEDVVLKVKSQIRKHGFYSNQTEGYPSFEPISYRKKVDNGGAAYFVKVVHLLMYFYGYMHNVVNIMPLNLHFV